MSKYRIVERAWIKESYLKKAFKGKLVEPFFIKKNIEPKKSKIIENSLETL